MTYLPVYLCVLILGYMTYSEVRFPKKKRDLFVDISIVIIVDIIVVFTFFESALTNGQIFMKVDDFKALDFNGWIAYFSPYCHILLVILSAIYGFICYKHDKKAKRLEEQSSEVASD